MSICLQFEERVIAEAAGDLETLERPALEAHLHECDACRMRLARERNLFASMDAGIAAMAAGEPSADFTAKVMAQVTGEAERKLLAAIDAGLAQSVGAEPSPAFAAAVRQRIAAEPEQRRAWFSPVWWLPATGALAAIVLLAILFRPSAPKLAASNPAPPAPPTFLEANAGTPPNVERKSFRGRQTPRESTPMISVATSASLPPEPEVLIPDGERLAVMRFYRFVQEGRINPSEVLAQSNITLAALLKELATPELGLRAQAVKTLDLVADPRSTSDQE